MIYTAPVSGEMTSHHDNINKPKDNDELLTTAEFARRLRVDGTTVRRWVKTGALEVVYLPKRPGGTRQAVRIPAYVLQKILMPRTSPDEN